MAMTESTVSIKLTGNQRKRLAVLAQAKRRPDCELLREAILGYLTREEKRVAFYREAEEAWADYQRTGFYISLEDMKKWSMNPSAPLPRPTRDVR